MDANRNAEPAEPRERVDELAEEAKEENPDPTTARETLELELMEEDRSDSGKKVELHPEGLDPKH
jgi:hypothetical protein